MDAQDKSSFVARILDRVTSLKFDKYTPQFWLGRQKIIMNPPPDSGMGYIQNPYNSIWNVQWGIPNDADQVKYRLLYRNVPKVKRAIDKTVSAAVNKGIRRFEYKKAVKGGKRYIDYLDDWIEKQDDWKLTLMMIANDMLVFGNSFCEIVYDGGDLDQGETVSLGYNNIDPYDPINGVPTKATFGREDIDWVGKGIKPLNEPTYERKITDAKGNKIHNMREYYGKTGEALWLKVLDPLYMRIRADSYGNIFGYIQWLSAPPVSFTADKIAHFRYCSKSTAYEQLYGTSMLQSLIRTQEAIWQIENDALVIGHSAAKPPFIFSIESQEGSVVPDDAYMKFQSQMKNRNAGADIFTRGDIVATQLAPPSNQLAQIYTHLHYHDVQRSIALGVPPALLGEPEGSSRTTAEVSLDDWINTLQILQKEIATVLEQQVFKHVLEAKFGKGTPVPHIVWNELFNKNENDIVSRIVSLKQSGIITYNESRTMLKDLGYRLEDLGKNGDVIQEIFEMQMEETQLENDAQATQMNAMDDPGTSPMPVKDSLMNPGIKRKEKKKGGQT